MVSRPPADAAAVEEAAREAAWPLPATLAAVVWRGPAEPRATARLPLGSVVAVLADDTACALVPDAAAPGRLRELARALDDAPAAVGPVVPWQETWRSAERAASALRLAEDDLLPAERPLVTDRHLPQLALLRDRRLLDDLAARSLAPLDGRTQGSRARLLETLRSWLDHQGRVADVAEDLHVHPQTVRYRLGQLREAFGPALDDPDARFGLMLAVRAPTGHTVPGP